MNFKLKKKLCKGFSCPVLKFKVCSFKNDRVMRFLVTEEFSLWNSHVISTSLARDYRGASQNRKFDRGVLFFGSKSFIKCSSYVSNIKIRIRLSDSKTFYFLGPP